MRTEQDIANLAKTKKLRCINIHFNDDGTVNVNTRGRGESDGFQCFHGHETISAALDAAEGISAPVDTPLDDEILGGLL